MQEKITFEFRVRTTKLNNKKWFEISPIETQLYDNVEADKVAKTYAVKKDTLEVRYNRLNEAKGYYMDGIYASIIYASWRKCYEFLDDRDSVVKTMMLDNPYLSKTTIETLYKHMLEVKSKRPSNRKR